MGYVYATQPGQRSGLKEEGRGRSYSYSTNESQRQEKTERNPYRYASQNTGNQNAAAAPEKKEWNGVTRIIARINGKDRVMDFRDGLSAAGIEDYASIHRKKSGKEQGAVLYASMIPITICDYSVNPSITVRANVTPQVCNEWYQAARDFITRPIGRYEYQQERINFHQQDGQGRCPFTLLRVTYDQNVDANGALQSKYPWNVQITKTTAVAQKRPNGSVCAAPGTVDRNAKPVFIRVSNSDFFGTLDLIHDFIQVWTMTYGPNLLRQGLKRLEEMEQQERRN